MMISRTLARVITAAVVSLLFAAAAPAEQTSIPDYKTARYLLWSKVYNKGGKTLYCNKAFGSRKGKGINVEHVVSDVLGHQGLKLRPA